MRIEKFSDLVLPQMLRNEARMMLSFRTESQVDFESSVFRR
jgi:hypothetical protein